MADTLTFELVSPDRLLMAVDATQVSMPGGDGDLGVLPGHAPLITTLRPGIIAVEQAGAAEERVFVDGGIAEVANDRLTVMAGEAIMLKDLNRATLEQRIRDAREDAADAPDDDRRRQAEMRAQHLQQLLDAL